MGSNYTLPWLIKPTALFRLYTPPQDTQPAPGGQLLIEVDNTGAPARHFRFAFADATNITVDLPAAQLLPAATAALAGYTLHYHLSPDAIHIRDSRFSGNWLDLLDEVEHGRITVTNAKDSPDAANLLAAAVRAAAGDDFTVGGALRWCIDGGDSDQLALLLQHLPVSLAAISGRPTFQRDDCPAVTAAEFQLTTHERNCRPQPQQTSPGTPATATRSTRTEPPTTSQQPCCHPRYSRPAPAQAPPAHHPLLAGPRLPQKVQHLPITGNIKNIPTPTQ